jgi:CHAD domain-containing protein
MADFTAALLDRPAVQAACMIALEYLDDATAAAARLSDRTDADALHDFRVAVRRLRVTVRAYPGLYESVPKKKRGRLKKLARATNAARDAEVQLAWFRDRAAQFTPAQRVALGPFRARLRARRRRAQTHTQLKLQRRFDKLERKLRRQLAAVQSDPGVGGPPFRAIAAATLVAHATALNARLASVSASSDPADLHATRIAAKRLRYLLEPVGSALPRGSKLVQRLKSLQDLFGELTDAHMLETELREGGEGTAAATNLVRAEVAALFTQLESEWSTVGKDLEREVAIAARQLRPASKPPRTPARRRRLRRPLLRDLAGR